ncbi:MAG: hypothetical protein Q8O99_03530 [bacterium]|nr:hypothetical protein [bacterium]
MLTKHHFGDHDRLCGILSQGKNASPSSTIMIMCHGKHSSKDSMTYVKMEKMCQDFRLDSFRFDFR